MTKKLEIPKNYNNKEEYVHSIFSTIAPKYDLLNTILSFNRDKYWRRFAVQKTFLPMDGKGLDVCCGTGELVFEQARQMGPQSEVV